MTLTTEQKKKFHIAADILKENLEQTKKYAERSKGISNGDSEQKKAALAKLIGK